MTIGDDDDDDDNDDDLMPTTAEDSAPGLETRAMQARLQGRLFDTGSPARIGDYVVVKPLGQGAMGTVFLAYDPDLDRRVAIKVLRSTGRDAHAASRMEREAKAMARLAHPNVVAVHEVGVDGDQVFVAMEYVEGGTLAQWCRNHPIDSRARLAQVLDLATEAAQGLAAAHRPRPPNRPRRAEPPAIADDGRLDAPVGVRGSLRATRPRWRQPPQPARRTRCRRARASAGSR